MTSVAFIAYRSLLDSRSGAAVELRSLLEMLTALGYSCRSITCTLFYGDQEFRISDVTGVGSAREDGAGTSLRVERGGVEHVLFRTRSSVDANLSDDEITAFGRWIESKLDEDPPDIVITLGSGELSRALHARLRPHVKRMLFYLNNEFSSDSALFEPFDDVLVPSEFMRRYFAETLGLATRVVPLTVTAATYTSPTSCFGAKPTAARRHGFVTYVNPAPEKGGTLFLRLVDMALRETPELTFLAVESRYTREQWAATGFDPGRMANVWWLPNQADLRRVYARTTALLVPSFWREAAGRVIIEAQLGGIPVLAGNHSGMPEQLNGGGFAFEIPERCREQYGAVPTEAEVRPWLATLQRLFADDDYYEQAVQRALDAARPWQPEPTRKRVRELFEQIVAGT